MKRLKSVFNTFYFAYFIISMLLFIFREELSVQMDPDFLARFINFWLILGFVFFVAIWVIQAVQIKSLNKDIEELEASILELKGKLYDFSRKPEPPPAQNPKTIDPTREKPQ